MTDNITLTEILDKINKNITFYLNNDSIEIDKDEYILSFNQCERLNIYKFNFNTINFNIKIDKLSKYTQLLYFNIYIINQKLENYNINDLEIDYFDYDIIYELGYDEHKKRVLNIIKDLENKNFNFELLTLENILDISQYCLQYLIDNNLYNFLKKDKYQIIKYCYVSNFKFFISYLDFDVYADYDGHTFYKLIFNDTIIDYTLYTKDKFKILYNDDNLLMNDKDVSNCCKFMVIDMVEVYSIEDIAKFNQKSLTTILLIILNEYLLYLNTNYINIFNNLLNLIENPDIEFLIKMFQNDIIINITADLFKQIINKIKMDVKDILDILKINLKVSNLLIFYDLYYKYCDIHISKYKNEIFNDKDIKILKNNLSEATILYNIIKYHFEE